MENADGVGRELATSSVRVFPVKSFRPSFSFVDSGIRVLLDYSSPCYLTKFSKLNNYFPPLPLKFHKKTFRPTFAIHRASKPTL